MLKLGLSAAPGRVELSTDPGLLSELQGLASRFASARQTGSGTVEIDLEDFLLNLRELVRWPDSDFNWHPTLLSIVEANAEDASAFDAGLVQGAQFLTDLELGTDWRADLTTFQRRDIAKLLALNHGANFSVPGAGKTRVAFAVYQARRRQGSVSRLLIVSPKSAFESWEMELKECFGPLSPTLAIYEGGSPPPCECLMTNYDRLPGIWPALVNWLSQAEAMLVLDEAHRTKLGPAGAWGAAALALAPFAKHRLILTGTPAPNGKEDLENLFGFVWPGQGRLRVSSALAHATLREASDRLKPLFVRTTKGELDLPPVNVTLERLPLPELHRTIYGLLVGRAAASVRDPGRTSEDLGKIVLYLIMAATTPALLSTGATQHEPLSYRVPPLDPPRHSDLFSLLQDLPKYELPPKYGRVAEIVQANAESGRKTLVWSTFVRNLTTMGRLLKPLQPAIVHGGTEDRVGELDRFRNDEDCWMLLSNPATLGEGISLHHECHDAIYIDRDFAAGRFLQSLDRIHRLGLAPDIETNVTVLLSEETIDEVVEGRLADKLRFMGGILDDPAVLELADLNEEPDPAAGMDQADIAALIQHLRGPG